MSEYAPANSSKRVKLFFYRPLVSEGSEGNVGDFDNILSEIGDTGSDSMEYSYGERRYIFREAITDSGFVVLVLQSLRGDNLPKTANVTDGSDVEPLVLDEGRALSQNSIFVFDREKGVLAATRQFQGGASVAMLARAIRGIVKEYKGLDFGLRFTAITKKDLRGFLKKAKTITEAKFTSCDVDGEDITAKDIGPFKDYLAGKDVQKVTKIKSLKGGDLKPRLEKEIEYCLEHEIENLPIDISMKIDGQKVDFSMFLESEMIQVKKEPGDNRYIDEKNYVEQVIARMAEKKFDD